VARLPRALGRARQRSQGPGGEGWRKVSDEEEPGLSDSGTTDEVTKISRMNISASARSQEGPQGRRAD
jgi:hypothetical protein